ncbi:MAG: FecR domain-containing protein [bacterium]
MRNVSLEKQENNHPESSVLSRLIRQQYAAMDLPQIDAETLSQRMSAEVTHRSTQSRDIHPHQKPVFLPKFAFVSVILVLIGLFAFEGILGVVQTRPVSSVHFLPESSAAGGSVPFLWNHRLRRGSFVRVPERVTAEIHLRDKSTVTCSGGTELAVRFDTGPRIYLNVGEITVHATQRKEKEAMIIETPLAKVRAVGTLFQVKVDRKSE